MAPYRRDDQERNVRPISLTRRDRVSLSGTSSVEQSYTEGAFPIELALSQSQGPWKKDRTTLSLEAQVILMEMRAAGKTLLDFAGHIYSNVVSHVKLAAGRILKLEPFGGYRLLWQNQFNSRL
jgi:hypothetical protein